VAGYTTVMSAAGLEPHVHHSEYHTEKVADAVRLVLHDEPGPLALFVGAGDLVVPALRVTAELGRSIPSDVALVAFDDHPFFEQFQPAITAVSQPIHALGEAASALLFAVMDGHEPDPPACVLPTRVVVRVSCGAAAPRSAVPA
jgi:LacI family transcriptional regulator